jgi:hypothetical protein
MSKAPTVLTLAAIVSLFVGRACADSDVATTPGTVQAPAEGVDVARGDEWTYQTRDSLTGDTLSDVDVVVVDALADRINIRLRVVDPDTGMIRTSAATFDLFWRRIPDDISPGKGAQDSWGVRPKLQVGEEWNYNFERRLNGGPIVMGWIGHGEALGVERVDPPNGRTVDALKIEFLERPSIARFHFSMRVVEWFAPEINRYVRREIETRAEGEITESTTEVLQDYVRRR